MVGCKCNAINVHSVETFGMYSIYFENMYSKSAYQNCMNCYIKNRISLFLTVFTRHCYTPTLYFLTLFTLTYSTPSKCNQNVVPLPMQAFSISLFQLQPVKVADDGLENNIITVC